MRDADGCELKCTGGNDEQRGEGIEFHEHARATQAGGAGEDDDEARHGNLDGDE